MSTIRLTFNLILWPEKAIIISKVDGWLHGVEIYRCGAYASRWFQSVAVHIPTYLSKRQKDGKALCPPPQDQVSLILVNLSLFCLMSMLIASCTYSTLRQKLRSVTACSRERLIGMYKKALPGRGYIFWTHF